MDALFVKIIEKIPFDNNAFLLFILQMVFYFIIRLDIKNNILPNFWAVKEYCKKKIFEEITDIVTTKDRTKENEQQITELFDMYEKLGNGLDSGLIDAWKKKEFKR